MERGRGEEEENGKLLGFEVGFHSTINGQTSRKMDSVLTLLSERTIHLASNEVDQTLFYWKLRKHQRE